MPIGEDVEFMTPNFNSATDVRFGDPTWMTLPLGSLDAHPMGRGLPT